MLLVKVKDKELNLDVAADREQLANIGASVNYDSYKNVYLNGQWIGTDNGSYGAYGNSPGIFSRAKTTNPLAEFNLTKK